MKTDFAAQTQLANFQGQMAQTQAYTDFSALEKIKQQSQSDGQGALREVAEQFESIFLNMVLKSMRAANEAFEDGEGVFNSQQSKMYRDMYDQQVSLSLTKGPGIGMADMLVKQLGGFVERFQKLDSPAGAVAGKDAQSGAVKGAENSAENSAVNAARAAADVEKPALNTQQQQGLQTYQSLSAS